MIAESTLVTKPEAVTKDVLEFEDSEKDVGKSSKSCKHVFLPNRVWRCLKRVIYFRDRDWFDGAQ